MPEKRTIRKEESILIQFLLSMLEDQTNTYTVGNLVEEYEGGKMGSISFGDPEQNSYAGDLIQVKYIDSDSTPVIITLTKDQNNELLDLDFWKVDFSKLLDYPTPDKILFDINLNP